MRYNKNTICSLFFLLWLFLLPDTTQAQKTTNSVYVFRFAPQKDMFFIPYGNNQSEFDRLSVFMNRHTKIFISGEMPLYVDGYCSSLPDETDNLSVACVRSNRVKSELILRLGLREEHFITRNHVEKGDYVTVRITSVPKIMKIHSLEIA